MTLTYLMIFSITYGIKTFKQVYLEKIENGCYLLKDKDFKKEIYVKDYDFDIVHQLAIKTNYIVSFDKEKIVKVYNKAMLTEIYKFQGKVNVLKKNLYGLSDKDLFADIKEDVESLKNAISDLHCYHCNGFIETNWIKDYVKDLEKSIEKLRKEII